MFCDGVEALKIINVAEYFCGVGILADVASVLDKEGEFTSLAVLVSSCFWLYDYYGKWDSRL